MPGGIFLSYRREDSAHFAGRLRDSIIAEIPDVQIFMDVDSIKLGEDFVDVLNQQLESCQAVLVVIGPNWINAKGVGDKRRLDDPDDFIRLEIETALARKIPLIPVLVDRAEMPDTQQIPQSLSPLRRRQFIRIDHENYAPVAKHLASQLATLMNQDRPAKAGRSNRREKRNERLERLAKTEPVATSDLIGNRNPKVKSSSKLKTTILVCSAIGLLISFVSLFSTGDRSAAIFFCLLFLTGVIVSWRSL